MKQVPVLGIIDTTDYPSYVIELINLSDEKSLGKSKSVAFVDRKMPTKELGLDSHMPIYQRCFHQAEANWKASLELIGHDDKIVPFVILRAFAIELYYKTIAYYEHDGEIKKEHRIKKYMAPFPPKQKRAFKVYLKDQLTFSPGNHCQ